jgi:putative methionine-R-sulfoxide reductase with GAF domain
MTRQLSQILPIDTLMSNMAHACASLLNSDSVGIRVVEGDSLVLAGVCGDALTAMATPRIKIGESLTGIVVATGESLLVSDPA